MKKLGIPILTIGKINYPYGVAVNQRGDVIVSECSGHCVTVLSPRGERLRSFGTRGSSERQFHNPCGVAVDTIGNILVADIDNHRIQKFTSQGEFLAVVNTQENYCEGRRPRSIAYNASNGKVYVGCDNGQIQILYPDLNYYGTFGKRGREDGEFVIPSGIACDSTGNVYVADLGNNRIQVFSAKGKFLRKFGWQYKGAQDNVVGFCNIAIDSSDRVYISETGNNSVSVLTSKGQLVASFKSSCMPIGLAVDSSGVVYVCNALSSNIQLF